MHTECNSEDEMHGLRHLLINEGLFFIEIFVMFPSEILFNIIKGHISMN